MILACPYCKAKTDPARTECASCGKKMSRACPACAETIAANATSCKYCGEGVKLAKEPVAAKQDCGIVFIEPQRKKKCCAGGRGVFWLITLALAGFCAYSAVKTRISCCHREAPVKQETSAPGKEF